MREILKKPWAQKLISFGNYVSALRVSVYASYACYFMILSLFPTLVLLLGLLRYTGLEVHNLTELISGFLPEALMPSIKRLILSTYQNSTGTLLSLSAVTALWSASRGVYGLLTGLNHMYRTQESRGYFYTRWVSILYTFGFLLVLLATLVLHVFGTALLGLIPGDWEVLLQLVDLRFFLLLFLQTALFAAIYTVLPNRTNRVRDGVPGALLASIGWMIFSSLFSAYVERLRDYTNLFGSVYAVALSMLWLYFCISIVFYGGALNHYLTNWEKQEKF